ncbi:hypothetical protein DL96DRAFT_1670246 [Flagelloscypha sp. PMI_526]|nr:hypothetical protein DL96DRAFT_1670246 [Flagelloscypha sp. PMI_526]
MDLLPSELLVEIFRYCSINDPLAPVLLSEVAHWWKGLVETSPRVWQTITLTDERPLHSSWSQADLFMKLSQPLEFDVFLIVEDTDNILPLLSPLLPSIARWRSFSLIGDYNSPLHLTPTLLGPKPLEMLHVLVSPTVSHSTTPDELRTARSPFVCGDQLQDSPYADDNPFQTRIYVSQLPRSQAISPLAYTLLTLSDLSMSIQTQPSDVLDFLTSLPQLESLYYRGVKVDPGPSMEPLPVPYLPHLHTLDIGMTCAIRPILSSLDVPKLERLYLSDINVDFSIHLDVGEEGDSDDEAGDFSQSPWSDHATGMGLRKLISRCHPPLRVLEMHYSDMRTKDFKYLFDRLHHLEHFRIVASDMSNTVLNLLRPSTSLTPYRPHHVRLPRLKRLSLEYCQRLDGDTIVDVLSQRVQFIKKLHQTVKVKTKDVVKMKKIGVVECETFTAQHAQKLEDVLGKCAVLVVRSE